MTLSATGGAPPYTWSLNYGSLPSGLSLNPATGKISGIPDAAVDLAFTLQVTDSASATGTAGCSLTILAAPIAITTTDLPDGVVGVPYSETLTATGGTPPYTWAVIGGALPPPLGLGASSGQIT